MDSQSRWQQVGGNAAGAYQQYLVPAMFGPWAATLVDYAEIRPGERVLDVACGTGVVARLAAARAETSGSVTGLDINGAMIAVARGLPPVSGAGVDWVEASALDIPLPSASFDVVLCQQGLQQFPDRQQALREIHRVLAASGRFAASVWGRIEGSPGMFALAKALGTHVGPHAADNRRAPFALGDTTQLRQLLVDAGFHDVRVETLTKEIRFVSPEDFVDAQLAATTMSTLGSLTEETHRAVTRDVRAALSQYVHDNELVVPMEAHIATARY